MLDPKIVDAYIEVLQNELLLATGCTEPIAIAYAAAILRQTLGKLPERIRVEVSGNIIKNVKSVVVPNTGKLKGIRAAVAAGIIAGEAEQHLQVISRIPPEAHPEIHRYSRQTPMEIICADTPWQLDIQLTGWAGEDSAAVRIAESHSNVVLISRNGETLLSKPLVQPNVDAGDDRDFMSVEDILEFANTVELSRVREMLDRQIDFNSAIAKEGLEGDWGANIGSVILKEYPQDIRNEAKAWAAAGSDARMSGCERPVVIVSGSGNQGMTASLPVIRYALHLGASRDQLYRALLISDLVTIHQKSGIGRLSAYCGAVSAGAGAGCGIAYLYGGGVEEISHTIVNALAVTSGIVCDGAKSSCAAKIAMAIESGIFGYEMYQNGQQFFGGDGLVVKGVENSITNFGRLGRVGMRETDREIIRMMTEQV